MSDTAPKFTVNDSGAATPPRRGRPPGSKNKTTATGTVSKADVDKAMAVLESGYNLITTGLVIAGLTDTATSWIESADSLNKSNRDALTASPKVTKAIISSGDVGGSLTFFITHGMAFAGLARSVSVELAARRAARDAERIANENVQSGGSVQNPASPDYDPSYIPGL